MINLHQSLKDFNRLLCTNLRTLCEVLLLVMTIIVLVQVFFRYGLSDALTWSEEASRFLMVWLTFLASPVAYLEKGHVALDFLAGKWTGLPRKTIHGVLHLLTLFLIVLVVWKSSAMVIRGLAIQAASLPIPMALVYAAIPLGFCAMLLINLQHLMGILMEPEEDRIP